MNPSEHPLSIFDKIHNYNSKAKLMGLDLHIEPIFKGYTLIIRGEHNRLTVDIPDFVTSLDILCAAKDLKITGGSGLNTLNNTFKRYGVGSVSHSNQCGVYRLDMSDMNLSNVKSMDFFCTNALIQEINMSGLNMPNLESAYGAFAYCKNLRRLDLSNTSMPRLTSTIDIIRCCYQIEDLNLAGTGFEAILQNDNTYELHRI